MPELSPVKVYVPPPAVVELGIATGFDFMLQDRGGIGHEKLTSALFLHNSWGRREEELQQKLAGWGHSRDFDGARYLAFWRSLDLHNHARVRDCHPVQPRTWPALRFIPHEDVAGSTVG